MFPSWEVFLFLAKKSRSEPLKPQGLKLKLEPFLSRIWKVIFEISSMPVKECTLITKYSAHKKILCLFNQNSTLCSKLDSLVSRFSASFPKRGIRLARALTYARGTTSPKIVPSCCLARFKICIPLYQFRRAIPRMVYVNYPNCKGRPRAVQIN